MNATTPSEAGGLTALATWIVACIIFSFSSFMSYVGILFKMKIPKKSKSEDTSNDKKTLIAKPKKATLFDLDLKLLVVNILLLSKPNVTQLNSTQPKATVKATSLG